MFITWVAFTLSFQFLSKSDWSCYIAEVANCYCTLIVIENNHIKFLSIFRMLSSFWAQVDEIQNVLIQDHNNINVLASVVNKEQAPVAQKVDSATHRIKNDSIEQPRPVQWRLCINFKVTNNNEKCLSFGLSTHSFFFTYILFLTTKNWPGEE